MIVRLIVKLKSLPDFSKDRETYSKLMYSDYTDYSLSYAAKKFCGALKGKKKKGWRDKSIGQAIKGEDGQFYWLHVATFSKPEIAESYVARIKSANSLTNIKKADVLEGIIWHYNGKYYVALKQTFICDPAISSSHDLREDFNLTDQWLDTLNGELLKLSLQPSIYMSCTQDLINRRLYERFGLRNAEISQWATIHGDLNWSNIMQKEACLLDWEGWGVGPCGLDLCFLYCLSLQVPGTSEKIRDYFEEIFSSCDGHICLLFVCAELLRMTELYGDHPDLYKPLIALSESIRTENKI